EAPGPVQGFLHEQREGYGPSLADQRGDPVRCRVSGLIRGHGTSIPGGAEVSHGRRRARRAFVTCEDTSVIRKAGSVLVGRDSSEGLQLLVLERAASSRFLPGYVAFPGGAVEPQDEDLARRWFGDPAEG